MSEKLRKNDMLKIIAMASMVTDHIGYSLIPASGKIVFMPGIAVNSIYVYYFFRIIGRFAFPIFAWYISEGFLRTKNVYKYMARLFIFGIISQVPFYFLTGRLFYLNVILTFFTALLFLYFYGKRSYLAVLVLAVSYIIEMDYGIYGLITVLIFHKFRNRKKEIFIFLLILNIIYCTPLAFSGPDFRPEAYIQMISVLSVFLIFREYKTRILIPGYFSYLFYPGHILLIVLIKKILF